MITNSLITSYLRFSVQIQPLIWIVGRISWFTFWTLLGNLFEDQPEDYGSANNLQKLTAFLLYFMLSKQSFSQCDKNLITFEHHLLQIIMFLSPKYTNLLSSFSDFHNRGVLKVCFPLKNQVFFFTWDSNWHAWFYNTQHLLFFFLPYIYRWLATIYYVYVCGLVAQSCPTLCDPMDCSLPGSSVHGILQARILEWVAISFSRVSSQCRDQTWVS